MIPSLILFLVGIGFLIENFGCVNGDQRSIFGIAETSSNWQNSTEAKPGNKSTQFFNDRQRQIRDSVSNPVSQFPFELRNSSLGPTLRVLEKTDTKTSQRKFLKIQTSENSSINSNSMSTSSYGQGMRLSLNRTSQQPNRSISSIKKLGSIENIDKIDEQIILNRSIHNSSFRRTSIATPAMTIIKNVTRRQNVRQEISTKGNGGQNVSAKQNGGQEISPEGNDRKNMTARQNGEEEISIKQNGDHEINAVRNGKNNGEETRDLETQKIASTATFPGAIITNVSTHQSGGQENEIKVHGGQEMGAKQNCDQEINAGQNDDEEINIERNGGKKFSSRQSDHQESRAGENGGQEMRSLVTSKIISTETLSEVLIKNVSRRQSGGQEINKKENGGQGISAEQNSIQEMGSFATPKMSSIRTLPVAIIKNLSRRQSGEQEIRTKENGGQEMSVKQNSSQEISVRLNDSPNISTGQNGGQEISTGQNHIQEINAKQNDEIRSLVTSVATLPGTIIKNVSRRHSEIRKVSNNENGGQEISAEQNYAERMRDAQNYAQRMVDAQNYAQRMRDAQNYAERMRDAQNYAQRMRDAQNYAQRMRDAQNYAQRMRDAQNYAQRMRDAQNYAQRMRDAQNYAQRMRDAQNYAQRMRDAQNYAQRMRDAQNYAQRMRDAQNYAQRMRDAQNYAQRMRDAQNYAQRMRDAQNYAERIVDAQNYAQKLRADQNDGQEMSSFATPTLISIQTLSGPIIKNVSRRQNNEQEIRNKENSGQEISTEQNDGQVIRSGQNDNLDFSAGQNDRLDFSAGQNDRLDSSVGQNSGQEIRSRQNDGQKINTEENGGQETGQNPLISQILHPLRAQLLNDTSILIKENESDAKTEGASSSFVKLIDYIVSFMKLSYTVVGALLKNETDDSETDLISEPRESKSGSSEIPIMKSIFTRHVSDKILTHGNVAGPNKNQSQDRERIRLINQINIELNGTNVSSTNGESVNRTLDFKTLINMARSNSKYIEEWRDAVRAFLSKQSHQFMDNGIYTKLSSFYPRSARTTQSWILRLSGYCSQIEIDEDAATVDSPPLFCPFEIPECDKSIKYRNLTGVCNNLDNPLWGSANIPYRRQLKNAYDDGISKPRSFGKNGLPLPNARLISKSMFDYNDGKSNELINLFTVFFGQFVSHDITRFAMDIGDIGPVKVNCCLPETINRLQCYPIFAEEEGQESTANGSIQCLHFLRSMPTVPLGCKSHVREQINQVTSFVDASNVYGSSFKELNELRLFQGGLMKMTLCGSESLPPTDRKGASECGINADQRQFPCFYAGDPRVNENPALALIHVLWLREHNRIARSLGTINPHWNDTRLYEETRKIIIALMQHVVYNELFPLILGFEKAKEFQLLSGFNFFNEYDPKTDPTLENGVAAAAFRFGHGMVTDRFLFMAGCPSAHSKCSPESILNSPNDQNTHLVSNNLIAPPMCPYMTQKNVSTLFENVDVFHQSETELESLLRGLLMRSAEVTTDTMLTSALTEKLFGHMDLMARNIQRGRDHGLPGYNEWRIWCGLPVARKFHSNQTGFVNHETEVVERLAQVYNHPNDVDLVIGGLTETPIKGAILGPTFVCILGRQFRQLKFGDRFWYEAEGQFTEDQLVEIRKIKMSQIILNNAGIESVPKFAFYKGSNENPFITSVDQVQLELSFWKEDENRVK